MSSGWTKPVVREGPIELSRGACTADDDTPNLESTANEPRPLLAAIGQNSLFEDNLVYSRKALFHN